MIPLIRSEPKMQEKAVLQRQIETGGARIALTARAAAKLIVEAAALVALGADDVQTPELDDLLMLLLTNVLILEELGFEDRTLIASCGSLRQKLRISAQ